MICKRYHNTTVDEIAKRAGVSTGIAYRYFKNKKEILLAALTFAFANLKEMVGVSETDLYNGGLEAVLIFFEKIHIEYRAFHEELEGLLTKKELKYMRGEVIRIIQKELWEE